VAAPKISLLLADPAPPQAFVMPSFIGQPLATAKLILQNAGLHLGNVTQAGAPASPAAAPTAAPIPPSPPPVPFTPPANSIVASQSPAPGEKVLAGGAVNFEVR